MERRAIESESLVFEIEQQRRRYLSTLGVSQVPRDTGNPVGIRADHGPRLNTTPKPIVYKYREGKLKRTPVRGVK